MSTFDIILLIFLGFGAFKGYANGFIVEVISFIAFFIGLFLSLELTIPVSTYFFEGSQYFDFVAILVFVGLFILLTLLIKVGAKAAKAAIDLTFFGSVDNIAGALAGAFKWAFVISVIIWVFDSVGFDIGRRYADDAIIFPYIVALGPKVFDGLGYLIPVLRDLIDSMESLPNANSSRIA